MVRETPIICTVGPKKARIWDKTGPKLFEMVIGSPASMRKVKFIPKHGSQFLILTMFNLERSFPGEDLCSKSPCISLSCLYQGFFEY